MNRDPTMAPAHTPATMSDCSVWKAGANDQKDRVQASDDKQQGDHEDGDNNTVQHDGTMGPHLSLPSLASFARGGGTLVISFFTTQFVNR
jgi:hypothetical protein